MSRYDELFAGLESRQEGAFIPFLMLGDPDRETCLAAIEALIEAGADALELGIPFSDPVADGPVIQAAAQRALSDGCTPDLALQLVAEIRTRHPALAIGLLVYANLVAHAGLADFYGRARAAGVDSVLIADVPGVECAPFCAAARAAGIEPVLIAPPAADAACIQTIAQMGAAYTYVLGRVGVTGAESDMQAPAERLITALQEAGAPPALVGFGLSQPAHLQATLAAGARGGIVGSALVSCLHEHGIAGMQALARSLKEATRTHLAA